MWNIIKNEKPKPRTCLIEAHLTAYREAFLLYSPSSKTFFSIGILQRSEEAIQQKLNNSE